tara:strand:- start:395 stop:814 length:420 start_codon:yes stop_codon:yes gene_type:complete
MSGILGGAGSRSGVIGETEIDYEEGTWTPVISGITTTVTKATYTKIGNTVFIRAWITAGGTGTTDTITGLPYLSGSDNTSASAALLNAVDWGAGTAPMARILNSSQIITLRTATDNAGANAVFNWVSGEFVMLGIQYNI